MKRYFVSNQFIWAQKIKNQLWFHDRGETFCIDLKTNKSKKLKSTEGAFAQGPVVAPMPGKILKVLCSAGQSVIAHEPLVIMEAMKMEYTLSAPQAAVVKSVLAHPQQQVDMGALLVELDYEV